jgi:hypothetical protein
VLDAGRNFHRYCGVGREPGHHDPGLTGPSFFSEALQDSSSGFVLLCF